MAACAVAGCARPSETARAELAVAAPGQATAPSRVDLAGSWRYLPYDGEGDMGSPAIDDHAWPEMRLPSSWFLLGRAEYPKKASASPRPFGDNAPGELWAVDPAQGLDYAGTVWFRRTVEWDGAGAGILDFDMVDYYADVFVNGVEVGHHEGYFQRWSVDATRALRRGKNLVAVKVSAPALPFDMAQEFAVSWPKMQNQIKGIFAYHDTRPGATSWRGQERSTGGILRGADLRASSGIDVEGLRVVPLDVSAASARLAIEITVHNWTGAARDAAFDGVVAGANFDDGKSLPLHVAVHAPPGVSRARAEVRLAEPRLWWTWDLGAPNLYTLRGELTAGGARLDRAAARFGVRSITRDEQWVLRLNGQRLYPRGTNYIATQWLSQADRAFYARDVQMMRDANLNAVRVHAHLERPEFYDVADESGMLVWQDFPLQWGYTDMPAFHAEALRQAEDMIRQYGDHPSIGVWCMHNEAPHAMTWMKRRDPAQNLALDEALAALARKLDPSRVVHRDSGTGDGHYYYGWYEGKLGDFATAELAPMVTEYGAAALPAEETLRGMFDARTLWPDGPRDWEAWQFADFQPKTTFGVAGVARGEDLAAFVRNTQRYQATAVRYTTELLRRRKWTSSTGIFQFMFVDDWPSITWSVVDYYRRPKAGYAALRASMAPLLASFEYDVHDPRRPIALWVVNDRLAPLAGARVAWRVTEEGKRAVEGERRIDVPSDGVVRVADLGAIGALASGRGRVEAWIEDASGRERARTSLAPEDFVVRGGG